MIRGSDAESEIGFNDPGRFLIKGIASLITSTIDMQLMIYYRYLSINKLTSYKYYITIIEFEVSIMGQQKI